MIKNIKPTRGRPEIPVKERRTVLMQFRLTKDEADLVKALAGSSDISLSDWIRGRVVVSPDHAKNARGK